ncbi:hypothetical protein QAD02_005255 [Eretmocerus hayati]|uniref:Uncharacterized protein n=1 Tax=Eretmocerus hayati TaxID=131215 RepID=A0ACC2NT07_9HYME|nr:hypothetical protein QAD02_005255 [Eretmocerus hayati]
MASSEINEFLCGPLVTWFISCLEDPNALTNYHDLVDGVLLHNVFLQIDPEPLNDGVIPSGGDSKVRVKNLEIVIDNMRQFYEEQLGHLLLVLPDSLKLGKDPEKNVPEAKLLLLLLLGCAVQCTNKEDFITKIKTLNVDTQLAIVDCIKQVTDYQDIVVTQESMENVNLGNVFVQVKKLMQERNAFRAKLKSLRIFDGSFDIGNESCADEDNSVNDRSDDSILMSMVKNSSGAGRDVSTPKKGSMTPSSLNNSKLNSSTEEVTRYAVELADWKSKVRKQRQELEEKTEALIECKEELEHNKAVLVKLKEENQELLLEARTAKSYRDELDAAIERAEKADRLEVEVARYREKLTDIEYYKSRIEELHEDNKVLMETKDILEDQLNSARKRSDKMLELESQIIKYEQLLNDMSLERVADKDKYQEVCEENAQLQRLIKTVASEVAGGALNSSGGAASDSEADSVDKAADNKLSEQLSNNAQARALKLELENRRLNSLIDSLKEESFHESSSRVLELEKDKKKLSLKVESLSDNVERLNKQNGDLESVCKQTLEENKKLQDCLSSQRASLDKQQHEMQMLQAKLAELERNHEAQMSKERQRLQALLESAEKRAEDAERGSAARERELKEMKIAAEARQRELQEIRAELEHDREAASREQQKLRELVETKDVALDEASNTIEMLEKKVAEFQREIGDSEAQISRLREIERSSKELDSRAAMDRQALESLQSNLVAEKLNVQQVQATLEVLGLDVDSVLSLPADKILDMVSELPEVVTMQSATEQLLSEKAKLQVHVARLESQSASLGSQQAALQRSNSRLEADVERLTNEHSSLQRTHAELSRDQKRLQSLHEQLNSEYESLSREKESLRVSLRDAKNEARLLRESNESLEAKYLALQAERDQLLAQAKSLSNLRGEHSKLKEDFRILFLQADAQRGQFRTLQEDHRKIRAENSRLSIRQTEMQGEVNAKDDALASLELENGKLSQRCEMLLQLNANLDVDRRSLMEHVSQLFSQYHELLTHSLEDKEHYHMEEKAYTDEVNRLYRQKEKLEEKIMEHYKRLDSCTSKRKSLGASLVKRVCKAGSGLFSRSNRRASWGSHSSGEDSAALDPLSLAHPGTRRTVYYNDDIPPPLNHDQDKTGESNDSSTQQQQAQQQVPLEARPYLIYNKVSAVINDTTTLTTMPVTNNETKNIDTSPDVTGSDKDRKTANSVWYEYGCV